MNALVTTPKFPQAMEHLFDQIFNGKDLSDLGRSDGYPPYNSWSDKDGSYKIEMAVAGFTKDDITINFDGRILSITGEKTDTVDEAERKWIFRGLAKRKFVRRFDVRGSFSIENAVLKNGILLISLKDETRRDTIEIHEE